MNEPLDEQYFVWLYSHVGSTRTRSRSRTYWNVLRQLYTKEFIWNVPNDDNRVEDGKLLRVEFMNEESLEDLDPEWRALGCSMLEMLIGLSRRLAFEAKGTPRWWFWQLMHNIGLDELTDSTTYDPEMVDDILDTVIWRTYEPNGEGGLFPLRSAKDDQRRVELWYQLNQYLLERY